MADGHLNKCKACARSDVKKHRDANLDRIRAYDRERGSRQTPEYQRAWKEKYPKKYRARVMIGNAVRDGKIFKPCECSQCGSGGLIHGHHDDYDYPLTVRWLCAACHRQWHAKHGEAKNAI